VQHLAVKAAVEEVTDLGEFTAIAAAYTADRVNDQIVPGAFAKTIERWRASGKVIPLHWNHSGAAADIIGVVDPASLRETNAGLYVEGKLDLEGSMVAREAWRSMKANAMSLSFGYTVDRQRRRSDGINELQEIDLFEVSIVPGPANFDTRVLSTKKVAGDIPTDAELRAWAKRLGLEPPLSSRELRRKCDDVALDTALEGQVLPPRPEVDHDAEERAARALRRQCDQVALDAALGFEEPPEPAEPDAKATPTLEELRRKAAGLGLPPLPNSPGADLNALRHRIQQQAIDFLMGPVE
jgi:uncharacterized protein